MEAFLKRWQKLTNVCSVLQRSLCVRSDLRLCHHLRQIGDASGRGGGRLIEWGEKLGSPSGETRSSSERQETTIFRIFRLCYGQRIPFRLTGGETAFFRLFTSHARFFSCLLLFPINISCTSEAKYHLACSPWCNIYTEEGHCFHQQC